MKKKKATKPRKNAQPKTRNHGSMTESAFWSFIRSSLRQKSRWWKPILECKKAARIPYKGENKRMKWLYKCAECGEYFPEKRISVDHIQAIGSLKSASDLPLFVERLFCEIDGLQVLHDDCHDKKTKLDNIKTKENGK
jgi:5-methylcytosine-specific restriction endonuclease McrA